MNVLVTNMRIEEIEDEYKNQLESAEKKFIEETKIKADFSKAELNYRLTTQKVRNSYVKKLTSFLEYEKKNRPKTTNPKKIEYPIYKVDDSNYSLGFYESKKIKFMLFLFKLNLYSREKFKDKLPNSVLLLYYKLKIKFMRLFKKVDYNLDIAENKIAETIGYVTGFFKRFFNLDHNKN